MSILGTRVARVEDPRFLTVGGTYVADLKDPLLDGALYVTYVRSTMAHATITVDADEARGAPGVVAVFTAADLDIGPMPPAMPMIPDTMSRPLLASDRVRFVGEPVAVLLTERQDQGADAAEQVLVDYEPLPALVDPEQADTDEVLLFPEAGTNCALELAFGRNEDLFDGCEVVVTERVINQRVSAAPLETRGAAAAWGDDGRVHFWISSQHAHGAKGGVAGLYGLDVADVHVTTPDVGGGFGAKISITPEEGLLPWLARQSGRPVRWDETRTENMVGMGHGRAQIQTVEIGGKRDGTVEAYRLTILQDSGAYPAVGAVLPFLTRMMTPGVYATPKVECNSRAVVTNTTPVVAYRGAGRPEAAAAIERAIDLFAAEIGMDAVEVRRRNLRPPFDEPVTTPVDTTYDTGNYVEALDRALAAAGYEDLRAEQKRRRDAGETVQLGIGVSVYVEVTAGPSPGSEYANLEVHPDGSATVYTGASPHGQGHETSFAMIVQDTTGIPMDRVDIVWGDTDKVARGEGTMGSRSLQVGGSAVLEASEIVIDEAKKIAAELLEANVDDVVLETSNGTFHVTGTPAVARTWAEVATAAMERDESGAGLCGQIDFHEKSTTFPFGAHVAVVDVDIETGRVDLRRMVTCDDAGRIVNPLLVEGQRHGGIAQGAAQALLEEIRYDDDGNPITSNFADYGIISAAELPTFELETMETPTPANPLGAKGIGESGAIGATPAVQSAVCDAVAHLGIRHIDIPCTPERVWRAIEAARV
ncbi:MAG TPA: xanthine dehydrogenase family protein molybdopterin-binding subunit [Acidimicrobiales bacterium]|nr:xanthine dehydrogenase family protein molybdopterin-binding subunit [Acidimicrobiales bacterium]